MIGLGELKKAEETAAAIERGDAVPEFNPKDRDDIQYDVFIPGYSTNHEFGHDVVHVDAFNDLVQCGMFTDWDGSGVGLDANLKIVQYTIKPSLPVGDAVEWVVWYNR